MRFYLVELKSNTVQDVFYVHNTCAFVPFHYQLFLSPFLGFVGNMDKHTILNLYCIFHALPANIMLPTVLLKQKKKNSTHCPLTQSTDVKDLIDYNCSN